MMRWNGLLGRLAGRELPTPARQAAPRPRREPPPPPTPQPEEPTPPAAGAPPRKGGLYRVKSIVQDLDLPASRKTVLLHLASYAHWETGERAYPSIARLSDETGLSPRTVQYCLRDLEERELITAVAPARRGRGVEYRINVVAPKQLALDEVGAARAARSSGARRSAASRSDYRSAASQGYREWRCSCGRLMTLGPGQDAPELCPGCFAAAV